MVVRTFAFFFFVSDDFTADSPVAAVREKSPPVEAQGVMKKSRKRQRNPSKRETAKQLRNTGKAYVNVKGVLVENKSFRNSDCGCASKCIESVTEDERKSMYENFYAMADFSRQNAYLCGLIHQMEVKQRRPGDGSRGNKETSNKYYLQKANTTVRVCKKFFLQTFQVSDGRVTRAIKKLRQNKSPGQDLRGKHKAAQKISEEQKQLCMEHISQFPAYQSHYSRHDNPDRKYLSPDLNLRKMFRLYEEWCRSNHYEPVKEYFYRNVFNLKFNLHFHAPRQDTCKSCDKYKQLLDVEENETRKNELDMQHTLHLRKAENARQSLKKDGEDAKENPEIYTITIDLQKALPFPKLSVSEAYYKRNMYCYNFGVHDVAKNIGYMYVWDETMASRGSQEVAACLKNHLKAVNKKHVIIYSDACTGQNRNIKLALTLMKLAQESASIDTIDHKFMVSGHSYLPNDSDFGLVEKESRGKTIFVPDDWYSIIKTARRSHKFMLVKMQQKDFLNTDSLEKAITKRKKNSSGAAVNWLSIQWLRYEKEKPFSIFYKETLNEDFPFNEIDIRPTKEGRPRLLKNVEQVPMYSGPRSMNHLKKRDMLSLLKYIPPIHHNFFKNIRTSENLLDSGPLTDGEEDVDE